MLVCGEDFLWLILPSFYYQTDFVEQGGGFITWKMWKNVANVK